MPMDKEEAEMKGTESLDASAKKMGRGRTARRIGEVTLGWFIALHLSLILNSSAGVFSKLAGRQPFLSVRWIVNYSLVLAVTFLFALAWQQVLKHMSLTFAFTNKPVTIIWGLVWGVTVFRETVTVKMILGSAIILLGIMIGVSGKEEPKEEALKEHIDV